jgi:Rad3-related DNA helicase
VITRFPADELLVAGQRYWRGVDFPVSSSFDRIPFSQNAQRLTPREES